ncbi:MAG: amidohydrolase family protein [Dehalococcoidia bacterium]
MGQYLIRESTVVTGNSNRLILYKSAIFIENGIIQDIGQTDLLEAKYPSATTVEGEGKVIFPGLINCHTHLLATADKGILEDFGFPTTLKFPTTGRGLLNEAERNVFAKLACIEAIKSGTTTLLEISNDIAEYAQTLDSTGLRVFLGETLSDIDDSKLSEGVYEYSSHKRDIGIGKASDLINNWDGKSNGRVRGFIAPHAPERVSPELLRDSRDLAEKYNLGYTIHLSQSYKEIEATKRIRGVLPTHYLFANEFLSDQLVAAHCRYLNSSEIALLGQNNVGISHNSAIGARRGAAAPVDELLSSGCSVGMGSDNMAEDMIEVMRAALFHERVRRNDEMNPQPEDVLQWGTMGGAKTLGIADEVGSLEVGKKADLFMIDFRKAHLVPTLRIVSSFVHNGISSDVTDVMVDGEWVMQNSYIKDINESEVIEQAEEIGHRVWNQLVKENPNVPFPINLPPQPL